MHTNLHDYLIAYAAAYCARRRMRNIRWRRGVCNYQCNQFALMTKTVQVHTAHTFFVRFYKYRKYLNCAKLNCIYQRVLIENNSRCFRFRETRVFQAHFLCNTKKFNVLLHGIYFDFSSFCAIWIPLRNITTKLTRKLNIWNFFYEAFVFYIHNKINLLWKFA